MQFFFKEKQDPSKHKNYVSDIHIFVKQSMGVMFRFILPCAADSYNYHLARSTHMCGRVGKTYCSGQCGRMTPWGPQ